METGKKYNENDTFLAKWLEGELSDTELKNLVSESDYSAFLKLRKGISAYSDLNADTATSFAKIKERISNEKPTKVVRLNSKAWWVGIAASVVILFGVFSLLKDNTVIVETGIGEKRTIALLDGSEVILNANSSISYDSDTWTDERALSLSGEAYFKVEKGSTFTVNTSNGNVTVLGTQFDVKSVSDYFEVVCYEGKVSVETLSEKVILTPSNTVRRINGFELEKWDVSQTDPSWIHGESSFKSVPLKYVISALESEYDIEIHENDVDLEAIFTGSFPHEKLNIALQTVFKSLDIQYFEKEKGHIYLGIK